MLKLLSHYSNKPVMQHVANAFTKLRYVTIHRPSPKLKKFRRPQDVKDVRANLYRRIPRLASSLKHCKSGMENVKNFDMLL